MEPPQSLLSLSTPVWESMCQFLGFDDHNRLHSIGGNPKQGCLDFYRSWPGVFTVLPQDVYGNPFPGCEGSFRSGDLHVVETVCHMLRKVTFITHSFHIDPATFRLMMRTFANAANALESVSVVVGEEEGLEFMTCIETTRYNWSRFLQACKSARMDRQIFLDVTIGDVKSEDKLEALFNCPLSDLRCEYLTRLDIRGMYKSTPERVVIRPDRFPNPTSFLLSKFPNLRTLLVD